MAPRQQEHLAHLASCLPFAQAARMLNVMLGVQVSPETARRLTEQAGRWMQTAQEGELLPESSSESSDVPIPSRRAISCDGTMVSLTKKQWVEVRTIAIGEPRAPRECDEEAEIHVDQLSYFSRLADASTFTDLAAVEVQRRQVRSAVQVCAVMDGADWLQSFTQRHRPDAVRILDFPHAAQHLRQLLEAFVETGLPVPNQMLQRCLHVLKHRGPRPLLRLADQLGSELAQRKDIQEHLDYLRKREALMHYPQFRQQG